MAQPLLTRLDSETAQGVSLKALFIAQRFENKPPLPSASSPIHCMGLRFENPLGLAAGCDKNGDYLDALGSLGFGHIEVGTVTPRPQAGNAKPRLFRLPAERAVVNSMGFNNKGIDHVVRQLQRRAYSGICGVNIGKNADTPLSRAQDDYLACLKKAYGFADYFVINVSSPNTERLRELQSEDGLDRIAGVLLQERRGLSSHSGRVVPILVKISPDLTMDEVDALAPMISRLPLDGVVATNTTTKLASVSHALPANVTGGLSGLPLHEQSLAVIRRLRSALGPQFPIIGVGGIASGQAALETLRAGANLIQVYTGFALRGPILVSEVLRAVGGSPSRG